MSTTAFETDTYFDQMFRNGHSQELVNSILPQSNEYSSQLVELVGAANRRLLGVPRRFDGFSIFDHSILVAQAVSRTLTHDISRVDAACAIGAAVAHNVIEEQLDVGSYWNMLAKNMTIVNLKRVWEHVNTTRIELNDPSTLQAGDAATWLMEPPIACKMRSSTERLMAKTYQLSQAPSHVLPAELMRQLIDYSALKFERPDLFISADDQREKAVAQIGRTASQLAKTDLMSRVFLTSQNVTPEWKGVVENCADLTQNVIETVLGKACIELNVPAAYARDVLAGHQLANGAIWRAYLDSGRYREVDKYLVAVGLKKCD